MGTKKSQRRIITSFCVRLDLLEELEKRVPKGERSAFLEKLLVSALEKTGPMMAQARMFLLSRNNKPQQSRSLEPEGQLGWLCDNHCGVVVSSDAVWHLESAYMNCVLISMTVGLPTFALLTASLLSPTPSRLFIILLMTKFPIHGEKNGKEHGRKTAESI